MQFPVIAHKRLELLGMGVACCSIAAGFGWSCSKNQAQVPPSSDHDAGGASDAPLDAADVCAESAPLDAGSESDSLADVADDGPTPDVRWLTDPTAWKAIPGTESAVGLSLFEALPDKIGFAPLAWTSCGAGCETADVGTGYYGDAGYLPSASTEVLGTQPSAYLQLQNGVVDGDVIHSLRRVIRLDDGVTVATARCTFPASTTVSLCLFGRTSESAVMVEISFNVGPDGMRIIRGAVVPSAPSIWAQPSLSESSWPSGLQEIDLEEGRPVFVVGLGAVRGMLDPTSSAFTVLEQPSASYNGAGQGDLAIWTDYDSGFGSPARIRGWAKTGGIRTIVESLPEDTGEVAISPSAIVGFMGKRNDSIMATARLWKTPRSYGISETNLTTGPYLPYTPWYGPLKTWGNFAAVAVRGFNLDGGTIPTGQEFVLVVDLTTWKTWRLDPPTGYIFHQDTLALGPTHLFIGLKLPGVEDDSHVRSIRRYDLGAVNGWATSQ